MSNSDNEVTIQSHTISQKQVNEQLRCSVCHEDFRLSEEVSRLVCDHVFHPPCISPWLERKDTCPVCRRVLRESPYPGTDSEDELADDEDDVEQEVVVGDGLVTVSVQYRSTLDREPVFHDVSARSSVSITISSDSDSEVPDFSDSSSSTDSNVDVLNTCFELSGDVDALDDNSHLCFLELDDSYDTDTSDTMDMDFMNTFDTEDFDFSSSNYFETSLESNMDIDHDLL